MLNKTLISIALVAAMGCGCLSAGELTVIEKKEKYGYADENGNVVVKPQFTHAYPFEGGKAKVSKGNKWGYIDETGKAVIPIQYDNIEPFENGLARVQKGKKYGYITEEGAIYIKPDYDFIGSFNEDGWLWVGSGKTLKESAKGLYHHDKLIIKPSGANAFLGFYVKTDSIDYTSGDPISFNDGAPVNNEIVQNFCRLSMPDAPFIWTSSIAALTSVYDMEGNQLLKTMKYAVGMPKDDLSIVRAYNKKKDKQFYNFNYLAANGKSTKLFKKDICQKLDPEYIYESCRYFKDGYAQCGTEASAYVINTEGKVVSDMFERLTPIDNTGYISQKGDRYGFLTIQGEEQVSPDYGLILPAFEGSGVFPAKDINSGKFGFIDFSGTQIVPFRFEDAIAFTDGKGYVKEDGKYGIVDTRGNYLVKNKWKKIQPARVAGFDYVWVVNPDLDKWQCLQISSDAISFANPFESVAPFDEKGRAIVANNDFYGAVSPEGSIVLPSRFRTFDIAKAALAQIDSEGKSAMSETDAYRFNIYNHTDRHKYRMHQLIDSEMWDY